MRFGDFVFMTPLPLVDMPNEKKALTREWVEPFRPVRQRTVRSETTKDLAGTLLPSVFMRKPSAYFLYQAERAEVQTLSTLETQPTTMSSYYKTQKKSSNIEIFCAVMCFTNILHKLVLNMEPSCTVQNTHA